MLVFTTIESLQNYLDAMVQPNSSVGFVPTMGALHLGHLSLIDTSKKQNDITVCSIFVNPTQFNDPKDFEKYPITLQADKKFLIDKHCDILFLPNVNEIYPNGIKPIKHYDLGFLEIVFDGSFRPGHFQGVCQVVERLIEIVKPTNLYLGQKDYQQCMVITKLVELIGYNKNLSIHICNTKREEDGLAMSSRNIRLGPIERKQASGIYHCFSAIKEKINVGNIESLVILHSKFLLENGFDSIDYLTIVNATTLKEVKNWDGQEKLVILAAAFIGGVRLIDNMILN